MAVAEGGYFPGTRQFALRWSRLYLALVQTPRSHTTWRHSRESGSRLITAAPGSVQADFLDSVSAQNPKTVVIIVLRVRNTTAGKKTKKKFSKSFQSQE